MIWLLLGPSGSGKSTLSSCLRDMDISELISHTTRPMRPGEVDGQTYCFVNREQFADIPMIEQTEYAGNWYGTSYAEVSRVLSTSGRCFIVVDRHGVEAFREIYGDLVKVIYIYAPMKVLAEHMKARGDNEDAITDRIRFAIKSGEMDNFDIADFVIINKDLDVSLRQLKAIVGEEAD